jgi:hypothetical protein
MFKHKMRPAHGIFASKKAPDVCRPLDTSLHSSRKGSLGEQVPAYVDSVMTPDTDAHPNLNGSGGAFNEPLAFDFATMQDGFESNRQKAPLTPVASTADTERREIWPSDDDTAAPGPQIDFARRDIHVPSRTRYIFLLSTAQLSLAKAHPDQFYHTSRHPKATIITETTKRGTGVC